MHMTTTKVVLVLHLQQFNTVGWFHSKSFLWVKAVTYLGRRCPAREPELFWSLARPAMRSTPFWGRAGPSGANVVGCHKRFLKIHGALGPVECQRLFHSPLAIAWLQRRLTCGRPILRADDEV
jgi:hypothetical protein